ncbi:hypothetical protein [Anaeromyxobacter sp. PSR-1]|uniref:hypothetical protein n=1 Tax=Anaeromyxobacter sp. PSR-1 TaxID=1300915 RepID=UPI0005E2FD82|nr:hypothetical protein [Anaeromyxobacter sp. PSR-1]GAO01250.1 hypothetical protein PSR1_00103 [Anaeromyxobacter sp. PSR-1]
MADESVWSKPLGGESARGGCCSLRVEAVPEDADELVEQDQATREWKPRTTAEDDRKDG